MLNGKNFSVRSSADCSRNNSPERNSSLVKNSEAKPHPRNNLVLAPPRLKDPIGKRHLVNGVAVTNQPFEAQLEYLEKIEGQYRELIAAEEQVIRHTLEIDLAKTQSKNNQKLQDSIVKQNEHKEELRK